MEHYTYYVNGKWKESNTHETITITSPYTEDVLGTVPALSQEEVDFVIKNAKEAQQSWKLQTIHQRAEYLYKWTENLLEMKEELATLIMKEVGKGYNDAVKEVERTVDLIRYTSEEAIHTHGESISGENFPGGSTSKIALIKRVPLGVVLAISPFNYPVNLSAVKIAPALITGNTVVFKPATQGAMSGIKMIEALAKTELPAGVVNIVTGRGSVIGDYLVQHPDIDMISFTGGTETGQQIASLAKMVPLVMELGGKDPAIVAADADLQLAAEQIISGAFSFSGQRCTAIKRIFVEEAVADKLSQQLKQEVMKLTVGSPEDNSTIVPLIDHETADYVQGLIDDAILQGATLLVGNRREQNLLYPTLFDHVTDSMRLAWEEPFGPVLPIIRVDSLDEAIKLSNQSQFGLQASVFTRDLNQAIHIAEALDVGTVQINGRTERGPDHFPFIGTKSSGMGAQGVKRSIEAMTREKVTVLNIT